jgi:biofilm PGA synthesis N-glycosyltransferase PgaC
LHDNPAAARAAVPHGTAEDDARTLDVLVALSLRQSAARLASTQPMPALCDVLAQTKPLPVFDPDRLPAPCRGGFSQRRVAHIVALLPAHNEAADIGKSIASLLAQTRPPDEIVVIPNGCTDATADIARSFPVTVLELPRCEHKKSQAMNIAWHEHAQHADIIVGIDGDTELPPHAVADWEREFAANPRLGGSSSQPVMTGNGLLPRIQRAEFTKSATISLRRGWCRVISGTGCAFRGEALREAARIPGQEGPWTYESVVEDYHLTFQLRKMGWLCEMSPTVWCYTGSMTTVRSLWHQRIKWQAGTVADLLRFGFNRLNWREWVQQGFAVMCIVFWVLWLALNVTELAVGHLKPDWTWMLFPLVFSVVEIAHAWKIRGRDWKDILIAGSLLSALLYTGLSCGWVIASWVKVIRDSRRDLWAAQYTAEAQGVKDGAR